MLKISNKCKNVKKNDLAYQTLDTKLLAKD